MVLTGSCSDIDITMAKNQAENLMNKDIEDLENAMKRIETTTAKRLTDFV
jgi:hypothetical protein